MVTGQLRAMARNLVGLLVALLLCGGGVQGHDTDVSHTRFERPRVGVSSRRTEVRDAVDASTSTTRGVLANTASPASVSAEDAASGITEGRLYGRSSQSDVESTGAFRSGEERRDITEGSFTIGPSEEESARGHRGGDLNAVKDIDISADIERHGEVVSRSKSQDVKTHESREGVALHIIGNVHVVDSLKDIGLNSSVIDRVDGGLSTLKTNEITDERTLASVEPIVATSERGDVDYNGDAWSYKYNYQADVDEDSAGFIVTSSEKSVSVADTRVIVKKGRRSSGTVTRDDKISTSTTLTATGEAFWDARRRQRQATAQQEEAAEMIPACRKFVEGNPEKREFHSPNFPGNYPNNTDCVKVLAAEPGHLLRLDFRDEFHVEPSEGCRFDYLEVRDGAHGYENLIGTFCGKEFPPMMTSSGRHLWLRFHSDENIEYSGFTAVYESIPKPTTEMDVYELPECVIEVGGSEGFLNTTSDIELERRRIVAHYGLKLECMWIIRVKPGWRIQLSFLKFELAKPNDCVSNFVDVFSDRTDLPSRLKSFCGSIADMVTSKSHILHVRYLAEAKAINSTFVALYTAFRDSKLSGSVCTSDEFDCQDETCISSNLRCNGRINCRFRWDEDECSTKISPMEKILRSDHIIIILVVFSLIMFGMCFAFVFNCVRKLMHDHKVIQENFRVSREGRLDEIGVKLPSPRQPSVDSSASLRPSATPGVGVGVGPECYVPGALLPILVGQTSDAATRPSNGDAVFARRDAELSETDDDEDDAMIGFPAPEMRDNECQTRESLFHCSDRSATPPPPPPPPVMSRHHHHHHHPPQPPVGQFSTFGYTRDNRREDRVKESPRGPPPSTTPTTESARFRAEAVIEMEGRGFSVDSTKSAPDVIVTH